MSENVIYSINGPVVKVQNAVDFSMLEKVYVGHKRLMGEVISISKEATTIQVYESTTGLKPGEPVEPTGSPISVTLGPGILRNIFDGIERPLKEIAKESGAFIATGSDVAPLDEEVLWDVTVKVSVGDEVVPGQIFATLPETDLIEHRCMIPPTLYGTVVEAAENGTYSINQCILKVKDEKDKLHELTLVQKWPIKTARPVAERLPISVPLITGQRIFDTLFPIAQRQLNGATIAEPAPYRDIQGLEHFDKVIDIDQSPIGRTPRSNPATYTGVFTPVRELFAGVPESRSRGYTPGRFSFNVRGGRCEACQGDGVIKVEMHFLPDIYVPCDQCKGKRYNRETLEIKYKGKTIHEVLDMTIEEAREFFDAVPALARKLQTLMDVGLTYIRLGQSATTLSGGEAQRVKLARELSKRGTGQTLYILDEPTTGLHFADIQQLLEVLHQLRDQGNTIVVIEHNLDVIKTADWIVDLGPEGGSGGGEILVSGTPETVAECEASHTARFLKPMLK